MATIINKSKVKDAATGFRVSTAFYDALQNEVYDLLEEAKRRAASNDRRTLMPQDL